MLLINVGIYGVTVQKTDIDIDIIICGNETAGSKWLSGKNIWNNKLTVDTLAVIVDIVVNNLKKDV